MNLSVRLRAPDGRVKDMPKGCVVEIVDAAGNLAALVLTLPDGTAKVATTGDPDYHAYLFNYKMQSSSTIVHEPLPDMKTTLQF